LNHEEEEMEELEEELGGRRGEEEREDQPKGFHQISEQSVHNRLRKIF
jgi:hypothetical protein